MPPSGAHIYTDGFSGQASESCAAMWACGSSWTNLSTVLGQISEVPGSTQLSLAASLDFGATYLHMAHTSILSRLVVGRIVSAASIEQCTDDGDTVQCPEVRCFRDLHTPKSWLKENRSSAISISTIPLSEMLCRLCLPMCPSTYCFTTTSLDLYA